MGPVVQSNVSLTKSLVMGLLTLKAPITTAADDIHKYFFIVFQRKIRLDVSSESSQALFFSKDKNKNLKCHLLQFLFGALRVKSYSIHEISCGNFFC